MSAAGAANVEPTFEDFQRLVRFTHLEKAYTNTAWVRVDGDPAGQVAVKRLQERYNSWPTDRFACFGQSQFERYYPLVFQEQVSTTLAIRDHQKRREAKRQLLEEVRAWLDEDPVRAKSALDQSAREVIEDLRKIESQLAKR
jgi:hypothetical protein